jgi:nucleotidyltransferase-like protein
MIVLPDEIRAYVKSVVAAVGDDAVGMWLFGSRANGSARQNSDWDLLLFSNATGLERLQGIPSLRQPKIDILVAVSEDRWVSPWPDGDLGPKRGSASLYSWRVTCPGVATYRGRPLYPSGSWVTSVGTQQELNAYQVWP